MRLLFLSLGVGNIFGQASDSEDKSELLDKMIAEENYAYKVANYRLNGKIYRSPFVAEAIIDYFKPDQIMLVGTVKSAWSSFYAKYADYELKRNNLETLYNQELNNGIDESRNEEKLAECEDRIKGIFENIKTIDGKEIAIDVTLLTYGLNERELKFNFDVLSEKWKNIIASSEDDEIHVAFDISHSFRSLPVFNITILNYLISLATKEISLDHVYYGNLDASCENGGIAEIVDLSNITDVMRLTNGVTEFTNSGNTSMIINEIRDDEPEIANALERFDWAIQTNRLVLLTDSIKQLRTLLRTNRGEGKNAVLYEMIADNIDNNFPSDDAINKFKNIASNYTSYGHIQRMVGAWHLSHGRFGQAIVSGQEALTSYMIPFYLKHSNISITLNTCTNFRYRQNAVSKTISRSKETVESLANIYPALSDCLAHLSDYYKEILDDRNIFAHIVWDKNENSDFDITGIKRQIEDLYKELLNLELLIESDSNKANELLRRLVSNSKGGKKAKKKKTTSQKKPRVKLKSDVIHFFTADKLSKGGKLMFGHLEDGKKVCMVVEEGTKADDIPLDLKVLITGNGPQGHQYVEKLKMPKDTIQPI